MRIAFIIIGLTAIAVGLVHIRRQEVALGYEIQQLQSRHISLRREIWSRQVRMGHLMAPRAVRQRSEVMALELTALLPAEPVTSAEKWTCKR